jgi:hypothetical protein
MAHFFGINQGSNEYTVTDGTSTTGKDIEVVINTTGDVPAVEDLLLALEKLENYILRTGKVW